MGLMLRAHCYYPAERVPFSELQGMCTGHLYFPNTDLADLSKQLLRRSFHQVLFQKYNLKNGIVLKESRKVSVMLTVSDSASNRSYIGLIV